LAESAELLHVVASPLLFGGRIEAVGLREEMKWTGLKHDKLGNAGCQSAAAFIATDLPNE
jgi:hypothetical protein